MPSSSIIIPTYNHVGNLKQCLESVLSTTDMSRSEVLVVANGCKDGTEDYVSSLGPKVRLLSFPEPLGFTGAVNEGIRNSSAQRVILLNDDCVIIDWGGGDSWVRMLEEPFSDPMMAATGSTRDVWSHGLFFLVFFCVMIRRDVLDEMGLLDMAFNPGAGEDCDFCLKAQARGYKIRQAPAEIDHWGSGFPIWHVGGITCGNLPGWAGIAARNTKLLEERYPRTAADRALQKQFSDGLQNIHHWTVRQ